MINRVLALFLALCLTILALPLALAEEDAADASELTQEELEELAMLDKIQEKDDDYEYNGRYEHIGPLYQEKNREDFNKKSPAIYTARLMANSSAYIDRDIESKRLIRSGANGLKVDVLDVGTYWAIIRFNGEIAYAKRYKITNVQPVDPVNTPPYGVQKHAYVAKTADVCEVRISMSNEDKCWVILNPGTTLSILAIQDGWAIVNYWRVYGYIDLNDLTDLVRVSPTDEPLNDDTPIAAYTSYYKMDQNETNLNRIVNIRVACERLSRVYQPGEGLDFNADVGPYKEEIGYLPAPVLVDGTTKVNYGGGTCQVSSTMYNALMQLPGVEIVHRRPHGPSGAAYLPHGVDAAVGGGNLNLVFQNNYDFPIRVEGHTSNDGALCMLIYRDGQ